MVYVLDMNGLPLMPTTRHGKVRHLLETGKAKVIKRSPFTIKLLYKTTNFVQPLTLGVDTGSGTFATAVCNEKCEILYTSEVEVRNDIAEKMKRRREYRRTRRNRKTRYRQVRFLNRKNSTKSDRHSPTMLSKLHSHEAEIKRIKSILPISTLVFETATFDTHLMKSPQMNRHWGYQQGPCYGFENVKMMVRARDNYICQHCKGKKKDDRINVHHIVFRSNGGSDEPENLIILCKTCHDALHAGKIKLKLNGKSKGSLKFATQMNEIRSQLLKKYPEAIETFGFVTKMNRLVNHLPKEHFIDACMVASAGKMIKFKTKILYLKHSVPKGDYRQTNGVRSEKKLTTGKLCGFRKFDKVKYFGKVYFIKGRIYTGYCKLMDIYGKTIDFSQAKKGFKSPKLTNCQRISARKSVIFYEESINLNNF